MFSERGALAWLTGLCRTMVHGISGPCAPQARGYRPAMIQSNIELGPTNTGF